MTDMGFGLSIHDPEHHQIVRPAIHNSFYAALVRKLGHCASIGTAASTSVDPADAVWHQFLGGGQMPHIYTRAQ